MELRGKGCWRERGGVFESVVRAGRGSAACVPGKEGRRQEGTKEGSGWWFLSVLKGSGVNQCKQQRQSCVVPLTSLVYLWGLGFFLLLTSLLSLFPFSLPAFIFLPASSKSPRWFNTSLSAFDLLSEGRFVRARAVSFAVALCFPWTRLAACGCFFFILHSWCVSLPLQDEREAQGEPGKVDKDQIRKEEGPAETPAGAGVRRTVGHVLAQFSTIQLHSQLPCRCLSWDTGARLRQQRKQDETLAWDLGAEVWASCFSTDLFVVS